MTKYYDGSNAREKTDVTAVDVFSCRRHGRVEVVKHIREQERREEEQDTIYWDGVVLSCGCEDWSGSH
jgi:hypothetical protein